MERENLQKQLEEIREKGSLEIGFNSSIFKDPYFDNVFVFAEIMPEIVEEGFFQNEKAKKSGVLLQARILDKYFEDIEMYQFGHLAEYFFNYKGNLK